MSTKPHATNAATSVRPSCALAPALNCHKCGVFNLNGTVWEISPRKQETPMGIYGLVKRIDYDMIK